MAKHKLNSKYIENLKPAAIRQEIADTGCPGLYLIKQPTGRTAWAVRYSFEGRTRKLTLDAGLSLAEARKAATAALHELERGHDPAALKFAAEAQAEQAEAVRNRDTVDRLTAQFIDQYARRNTRPNSVKQAEHVFRNIVMPAWGGRTVHDIKRRDVHDLVNGVAEDRPVMANRVLAHLSKFFNWLCERDIVPASPCAGVKRPSQETARDRVLSDDEIVKLWAACETIGGTAGPAIKLLLLTGQRCGEVVGMRRSEISADVWTLSAERTKNHQKHQVPLSAQALAIIEAVPAIDEDFVFTTSVSQRLAMGRAKTLLDAQMQLRDPWVIHDLRRTVATGLQKLGVRVEVTEAVLNHKGGSFKGVIGIYQRHQYAVEKRAALERWAARVQGLVTGTAESNVVRMRG
jgi:integrase